MSKKLSNNSPKNSSKNSSKKFVKKLVKKFVNKVQKFVKKIVEKNRQTKSSKNLSKTYLKEAQDSFIKEKGQKSDKQKTNTTRFLEASLVCKRTVNLKIQKMSQGPPNPRLTQSKYKKWIF